MAPTALEAAQDERSTPPQWADDPAVSVLSKLRGRTRRRAMAGLAVSLLLGIAAAALLKSSPTIIEGLLIGVVAAVSGLYFLRYWTVARFPVLPTPRTKGTGAERLLPPPAPGGESARRASYWLIAATLVLSAVTASQIEDLLLRPVGWLTLALSVIAALGAAHCWDLSLRPVPTDPSARGGWLHRWWGGRPRSERLRPTHLAILVGILLIGAALRFHLIAEVPFGLWFDEAGAGLEAASVASGREFPIYFAANLGRTLQVYVDALFISLLGKTILPLRVAPAFIGVLGIAAIFQAGRAFFGVRTGLVAAFLLAVSRWDITFSRLNLDAVYIPLIVGAALGLLVRGLRRGSALDLGLAAGWAALGWYSYLPLRAFPLVLAVGIAIVLVRRGSSAARLVVPLLFAALVGLAGLAPLAVVAIQQPEQFNSRVAQASVFAGKSLEAALPDVMSNVERHLLMFHRAGDRNGRHNLPGAPMLDMVTGGLFLVGLGYALRYWYRARFAMLVVQFAVMLAAGILSVAFEAPQSLRSFGTLPVVVLLAAIGPGAFWDMLAAGQRATQPWSARLPGTSRAARPSAAAGLIPGRVWSGLPAALGLAAAAVPLWLNAHAYFALQANDFAAWAQHSTAETVIGLRLARDPTERTVLASPVYLGHPTIRYLVGAEPTMTNWEQVGLPVQGAPNGALIFLQPDLGATFRELQRLYPQGRYEVLRNAEDGPPALYIAELSTADLRAIEGAEIRIYPGTDVTSEPVRTLRNEAARFEPAMAEGIDAPFTVEWRAVLRVPRYGDYRFDAHGAEIWIDERPVSSEPVRLARGNHSLRAVQTFSTPEPFEIQWQLPDSPPLVLGPNALYQHPVTVNGLLGRYFPNNEWSGEPALEQIDPVLAIYFHIVPLQRPYTVEWTGKLLVPESGTYRLGTEAISATQLFIDGQELLSNSQHNAYIEAPVELTAGLHDIRLRFADRDNYSHVNLFWTPPGRPREIIPSAYLLPPAERFAPFEELLERARADAARQGAPTPASVLIPGSTRASESSEGLATTTTPADLRQPAPTEAPRPQPKPAAPGEIEAPRGELSVIRTIEEAQLVEPRDIAVGPDSTIYVLDSERAQVLRFNAEGQYLGSFGLHGIGDGQLEEPTGLVIDSAGRISVIDAISGWIHHFDASGQPLGRTAGPTAAFYRPRGLAIGPDDRLYVPDTGGGRVVILSSSGAVERQVGVPGNEMGTLLEPVDVLPLPDGGLIVLEVGNARLQRFDAGGRPTGLGPLPGSVAADGSHFAALPDGTLVVTDPQRDRLLRYSADLVPIAAYGRSGSGPGEFRHPIGIFATADGTVYVADTGNRRVQQLKLAS